MQHEISVGTTVKLFSILDDFTPAWEDKPAIIMVHGFAESSKAWQQWVPYLATEFKVIRYDQRGYGQSTPMPADYPWTLEQLQEDITAIAKFYHLKKFHLIGAKSGGSLVLQYAASHPNVVLSVIAASPPLVSAKKVPQWQTQIENEGVKAWAHATMKARLGTQVSQAEINWWVDEVQGKTPVSTLLGYLNWIPHLDLRQEVLKIICPTLIISASASGLRSIDEVKEWQEKMLNAELFVVDGDAWHPAAAYPKICARKATDWLNAL